MTARTTLPLPASPVLAIIVLALWAGMPARAADGLAGSAEALMQQPHELPPPSFTLRSEDARAFTEFGDAGRKSGSHYGEVTGWLTPARPASLGLTLGVLSSGLPGSGSQAAPLAYDMGVRWRSRLEQRVHLDVQAWTRTPQQFAAYDAMGMIWSREPASVGTRLEVQWKPSRTGGLVPEFGAIGVQLQGDAKLLLRAKRGGPMLYYRAKF